MSSSNGQSSSETAEAVAKLARAAFEAGQLVESEERVVALRAISTGLTLAKEKILAANAKDVEVSYLSTEIGMAYSCFAAGRPYPSQSRYHVLLPPQTSRPPILVQ